jgi:hypothetical protein
MQNPAIGKLLLDFGCTVEDSCSTAMYYQPLLSVAAKHCPDMVFPLLLRGASQLKAGPDGISPIISHPEVFREARWKMLRSLFLLRCRACPAIDDNALSLIVEFFLEPVATRGLTVPRSDREKDCRLMQFTAVALDSLSSTSTCTSEATSDFMLSIPMPDVPWKQFF